MADIPFIVLLFFHSLFAVGWLGAVFFVNFVLMPQLQKVGHGTRREFFMNLTEPLTMWMTLNLSLTLVTGLILFGVHEGLGELFETGSSEGMIFLVSLILTVIIFLKGMFINTPSVKKITKMLEAMEQPPKGPPPAEFLATTKKIQLVSLTSMLLGIVVLGLMAVGS